MSRMGGATQPCPQSGSQVSLLVLVLAGVAGVGTRGQGGGAQGPFPLSSPSPMGEVADVGAKGSPKAESAVGWQVRGRAQACLQLPSSTVWAGCMA
jgi:hypothetical protein